MSALGEQVLHHGVVGAVGVEVGDPAELRLDVLVVHALGGRADGVADEAAEHAPERVVVERRRSQISGHGATSRRAIAIGSSSCLPLKLAVAYNSVRDRRTAWPRCQPPLSPGLDCPRIIVGTNSLLGWSHTSSGRDEWIRRTYTAERVAEVLIHCASLGATAVVGPLLPRLVRRPRHRSRRRPAHHLDQHHRRRLEGDLPRADRRDQGRGLADLLPPRRLDRPLAGRRRPARRTRALHRGDPGSRDDPGHRRTRRRAARDGHPARLRLRRLPGAGQSGRVRDASRPGDDARGRRQRLASR